MEYEHLKNLVIDRHERINSRRNRGRAATGKKDDHMDIGNMEGEEKVDDYSKGEIEAQEKETYEWGR